MSNQPIKTYIGTNGSIFSGMCTITGQAIPTSTISLPSGGKIKSLMAVFAKDRMSFDTFLALGKTDKDAHDYVFVDDLTEERMGSWGNRLMILSDFHEHPRYIELLDFINEHIIFIANSAKKPLPFLTGMYTSSFITGHPPISPTISAGTSNGNP